MADKDGMERKVYLLPKELVDRIKAYQKDFGLPSEVEAARRLLSEALQSRDSMAQILLQVRESFKKFKNIRSVAKEVLIDHINIKNIEFHDDHIFFETKGGERAVIVEYVNEEIYNRHGPWAQYLSNKGGGKGCYFGFSLLGDEDLNEEDSLDVWS
ncbi:hypothetical protein [Gluconobacter oxydans]|uniref:hypothetical protein n=1 Tax=Gluconobacter oxydans TaxID=442 RepID=UPI00155999DC|nr:hypothetical protein [Gluconobacter oxydans]